MSSLDVRRGRDGRWYVRLGPQHATPAVAAWEVLIVFASVLQPKLAGERLFLRDPGGHLAAQRAHREARPLAAVPRRGEGTFLG